MSEEKSPSTPESTPTPSPKKKPRRSWGQRLKLTVLVLLILACVFRIALNILLPTVIRKVAAAYDLDCGYGRIDLSLLGGNAHIWDFQLRPKSGGESIVAADYVQGNISPLNLLRGRLVVYRAEVDGVKIVVDREKDGSIPLLKKFLPQSSQPAAVPVATKNAPPKPLSLQSPLRIDAVRISHVDTTFRDRSVNPPFETTIKTTLRISDVGSTVSPAQFELEVEMDPLMDTLYVQGEAHNTADSLTANVQVLMRGLHLKPAAGYLAPLGLKPVADSMTVKANLTLAANVIANSTDISAQLAFNKISAVTDDVEFASLEKLTLDATKITSTAAKLGRLVIENGKFSAQRTADRTVRLAGLELVPVAPTTQPIIVASPTTSPTPQSPASPLAYSVSLDELNLKNLQASFDDQGIKPAANLVARVDDLSVKGISIDPATQNVPITIAGSFSLPGLIQTIHLTGSATPFAPTKHLIAKVQGQGVKPDAIKPYLDQLGIESQIQNASVAANLDASASIDPASVITANANVSGIHFDDAEVPLLGFDSAKINAVTFNPSTYAIGIGTAEFSGPTLQIRRDHDGRLAAAGFRLVPPASSAPAIAKMNVATASPVAPTTAPASAMPELPRIEIGRLRWDKIHIGLRDEMVSPPAEIMLGDAGVEVNNLLIDLKSTTKDHKPGSFRAWLAAPHVIDSLAVDGALSCSPHRFAVDMSVIGDGITGAAIEPYLKNLGIVPVMKAGAINLKSKATLSETDGKLAASLDLSDVKYTDGQTELAAVDDLHLAGLTLQPTQISVDDLTITNPRASIARNADGTLEAGGIRIVPVPPSTQPAAPAAPGIETFPTLHLAALPIKAILKNFELKNGSLAWTDNAVSPAVQTRLTSSVLLTNAQVGSPSTPANLHVTAKIDGSVDDAVIDGTLMLNPEAPAAHLQVVADGVRVASLAAYLPPNIASTLKDGRFETSILVEASNNPAGGIAAKIMASKLAFTDDSGKTSLAKVDSFTLVAPRIDLAGGAIALSEITSTGVAAEVRKMPDGAFEALGMRINPAAAAPPQVPVASTNNTAPASPQPSAPPATQPVPDTATLVANARRPLPLLTIDKLDLNLQQFRIVGMTGDGAAPIVLENASLKNLAPIALGGPDAESRPSARLQIDGGIDPVVSQFGVTIESAPLAPEPSVKVDLAASGIKGDGLTKLLPSLRPTIDGSKLTDGAFKTHLDASLNYGRRGPRDVDLSRGFTAMFDVKPVEFRATQTGPVIAGLDEIRSDGIKVVPATGDLQIKTIEISKPIGRFERDAEGIHAFGFVLPIATTQPVAQPAATTLSPTTAPTDTAPTITAIAAAPTPTPSSPPVRPTNEIRLDQLTVSGIDVIIEDHTSTPPTVIPLKSLDVEVDDVSNQTPWNGKPVRFSMLCTSDKVPMPPRKGAQGVAATQQSADGEYTEMRELFSQVTAAGRVGIKQTGDRMTLDGWAKTSVNGFELLGVRGLAKQYGVKIGGGAFDDSNDFRFQPDGLIETKNKIVFTNLSLSEPANGPLQQVFKLPAPIDVAIGAVTDPDGSITMDLPVPIKSGAVSTGDVIGPAIGAVGGVLITGIASAPVKAIGGVGSLIGLGGKEAKPEVPVEIHFLPGYTALDRESILSLDQIAARLHKDKNLDLQLHHTLTAGDVARASVRANPSPEDCLLLADRLRKRKAELLDRRAELSAQARGQIGSQSAAPAAASLEQLRDVDRQIAHAEDSLDQLYDMLRPGADSQIDRRTRAASLDIGKQRMETIRDALAQALGNPPAATVASRISLTNPQFDPTDASAGGEVVITLIPKKH